MDNQFLTLDQVIEATGSSRSSILRWAADGTFPPKIKLSAKKVVFDAAEVEAWLADKRGQGQPERGSDNDARSPQTIDTDAFNLDQSLAHWSILNSLARLLGTEIEDMSEARLEELKQVAARSVVDALQLQLDGCRPADPAP